MINGGFKCRTNDKCTGSCKYVNGCTEGSAGNLKRNAGFVKKTLIKHCNIVRNI
jgi:hypothetical protein